MGDQRRRSPSSDRAYLLRRCEGFRVEVDGRAIGRVACLSYGSSLDRPDELIVERGRLRRHTQRVSVADVAGVSDTQRLVTLRG
jgi:hypothetical protein